MTSITHHAGKFYVVTSVFNPKRYRSRYTLYEQFAAHMRASGANLYTVEVAFGQRGHLMLHGKQPNELQLRTQHELWLKENALNLLVQRLPSDWKYLAWIDADIRFTREDWINETLQQLQHHAAVQMWSEAIDLGPHYQTIATHRSFVQSWMDHGYQCGNNRGPYQGPHKHFEWHPGFAWAIRREAWESLGGLLDFCILGAADQHMAHALVGNAGKTLHRGLTANYKQGVLRWQERATQLGRNIGVVPGTIQHYWHGKKRDRRYRERWQILIDYAFDPLSDLVRDWQGLWQLTDRNWRLRRAIADYFGHRNEDSIDTE